jgi:hypothetical protein
MDPTLWLYDYVSFVVSTLLVLALIPVLMAELSRLKLAMCEGPLPGDGTSPY